MPEELNTSEQPKTPVRDEIEELAQRLREADHLDPQARSELAHLLSELAAALEQPQVSVHTEELAERTAKLVRAVKEQHEPGLIEAARTRLEDTIARAEAKSPVVTEIVLRLVDVIAAFGI